MSDKTRVLVVDDQYVARSFFEFHVDMANRYELAASLGNAEQAIAWCMDHPAADIEYKVAGGQSGTFTIAPGDYTIEGKALSKDVEMTISRENWIGITKISPANNGQIIRTYDTKFEYVVNYEPKNANAKISADSPCQGWRITLKSQSNGVATFEVDYKNYPDKKQYVQLYSSRQTARDLNNVTFTSENGVTAEAEMIVSPKAPQLAGKLTGTTKTITIPIASGTAGAGRRLTLRLPAGAKRARQGL